MRATLSKLFFVILITLSFTALCYAAPLVTFTSNSSSGPESLGTIRLQVILTEESTEEISVPYSVTGGSALNGVDYELQNGVLVYGPGETSKEIEILVYDDAIEEGNEDIVIDLATPSNAELGSISEHTYTILDNDGQYAPVHTLPTVSFTSASSSGPESVATVAVGVKLSEQSGEEVTVDYDITGLTAQSGSDFTGDSGTISFSPGETEKTINFTVNNDTINEQAESLTLELRNPQNVELGEPSYHTYTIEDDDTIEVNFVADSQEGEEADNTVSIGVELTGPSELPITVYYSSGGSASPPIDYEVPQGYVTFEPGVVQGNILLTIKDDEETEEDENIRLTLDSGENVDLGDRRSFTYTIKDNDRVRPYVCFTSDISIVSEDQGGIDIEVGLSEPTTEEVSVQYYVTAQSTAVAGSEYNIPGSTITFPPGVTRKLIHVDILEDDEATPDRNIVITLRDAINAKVCTASTQSHTVWRIDDDQHGETLALFKQEIGSTSPPRTLMVVGPKTMTVNPGGVAVDGYGNLYITDQGPTRGENEGSVLMWPKGLPYVIRIISDVGLTRPTDVELSMDQKELIVADLTGVHRFPLGLSVRLTNIDPFAGDTRVHVLSKIGEKVAKVSPDGYFHFPGILVPGQGSSVKVVVEHGGVTTSRIVFLGQPGMKGGPIGHTIANLEY